MTQTRLSLPRELLIACIAIVASIVVLPGLIYVVGSRIFGAYGAAGGVLTLYKATLANLAAPTLAAWTIVLCPALCIVLLRLVFGLTQDRTDAQASVVPPIRREPTIKS
jgi:hypothetical protein